MPGRRYSVLIVSLVLGAALLSQASAAAPPSAAATDEARVLSLLPADTQTPHDLVAAVASRTLADLRGTLDLYLGAGWLTGYDTHVGDGLVILRGSADGLGRIEAALGAGRLPGVTEGYAAQADRLRVTARVSGLASGPSTLTANATIGDSLVFGSAPEDKPVVGKLYDANGNFLARSVDEAHDGGYSMSFGHSDTIALWPGYSVRLEAGIRRLTFKIVPIRITSNRVLDLIAGTAPKRSGVIINLTHYDWTTSGAETKGFETAVNTDAEGKYSFDVSAFLDLVGGDDVAVRYEFKGTDNPVTARATVPYLVAFTDRAVVAGHSNPYTPVKLTVKSRLNKVIYTTTARPSLDGDFDTLLTDGLVTVTLRPLMTVIADLAGLSLKVPKSTATLDVSAEMVSGKGPPKQFLRVQTQNPFYTHYGFADKLGRYSVDLSEGATITSSTLAAVVFREPSGDQVYRFVE